MVIILLKLNLTTPFSSATKPFVHFGDWHINSGMFLCNILSSYDWSSEAVKVIFSSADTTARHLFGSKKSGATAGQALRCAALFVLLPLRCMRAVWSQSQLVAVEPQSDAMVSFVAADVHYNSFISRSRSGYKKISRKVSESVKLCHCDSVPFIFLPCVQHLQSNFSKPPKPFFPFQINLLTGSRATFWLVTPNRRPSVRDEVCLVLGDKTISFQKRLQKACGDGVKRLLVWQTTVKLQLAASIVERLVSQLLVGVIKKKLREVCAV